MEPNTTAAPASMIPVEKPSEKFIRTFESDMEASQKGGTAGMIPLKETPKQSVAPSAPSVVEMPAPIIKEEPIREILPEPVVPKPEPIPLFVTPKPPEVQVREEMPTPIETYSDDFKQKMKETSASVATVVAAEQDAAQLAPEVAPENKPERSRTLVYVISGVLLLGVGGVGVYFAYSRYLSSMAPIGILPTVSTPIFVDGRENVSGTGAALVQAIEQSVASPLAPATVRALILDDATKDTNALSAIGAPAPGILLRNINAEGSMVGVVNTGVSQSPFFILSVESYSTTFSGMLLWELTMQSDLSALFPAYPVPEVASSTASTTVATTTRPHAMVGFNDDSVSNHDVRIYRDAAGRSVLLYGYWNQSTLIIARDQAAFVEILRRLATSHS